MFGTNFPSHTHQIRITDFLEHTIQTAFTPIAQPLHNITSPKFPFNEIESRNFMGVPISHKSLGTDNAGIREIPGGDNGVVEGNAYFHVRPPKLA